MYANEYNGGMSNVNDEIALAVLSANLQRELEARGWSIRELARKTGDPVMTIHNAVSGRNLPKVGVVVRVADVLGLPVDALFEARAKKTAATA